MEGTVPAGYEEYLQGSRPKIAAPMMPDTDGATVYDFTFDKVSARWAAENSQHRHLRLIALTAKCCKIQLRHPFGGCIGIDCCYWTFAGTLLPCC